AGVLVKKAEALEVLERVDTLVVDKTGTLTEGRPRLVSVEVVPGLDEREVLALAAGLEQASEHPLAAAIVAGARARGLVPPGAAGAPRRRRPRRHADRRQPHHRRGGRAPARDRRGARRGAAAGEGRGGAPSAGRRARGCDGGRRGE